MTKKRKDSTKSAIENAKQSPFNAAAASGVDLNFLFDTTLISEPCTSKLKKI